MTIDLTDADRRHIDAIYEREWGGGETKVAEYYLCEAAYRAGLAAGRERAIEECTRIAANSAERCSRMTHPDEHIRRGAFVECAAAIRSLLNAPAASADEP